MPAVEQEYATPQEAYLAHHGIKGMRWGQRTDRAVGSVSSGVKNAKDSVSTGVKNTKASVAGGVKSAKTSVSTGVKNAKTSVSTGVKNTKANAKQSVEDTKSKAKLKAEAKAQAKAIKIEAKAKKVGENEVVKGLNNEAKHALWGTRQAYIEKTISDAERAEKIGKGTAAIDSKVVATKDLIFTKKQAKWAAPILAAHAERVKAGKYKTVDLVLMSARLRRRDLTIGVDLGGKRAKAAEKRGKEAKFNVAKGFQVK